MIDLRTLLTRAGFTLAVLALVFLALAASFRVQAGRVLRAARDAEARGDIEVAVAMYDEAIRRHSPFSGAGRAAAERLETIAADHEANGRRTAAWRVYQTLLSALCAVETGFSGNGERIRRLEEKVEALLPSAEPGEDAPAEPS